MNQRGLTLIELLITCSILGILLAIGIPSFQQQLETSRTRAAADALLQAIHLTRSKAVSTNRRATLRRLDTWHAGWEVFYDRDFDGERDADEQQITTGTALIGVTIDGNGPLTNYVSFIGSGESRYAGTANGGGFQAGTFTICPTTPGEGYQLILARSGRVRVDRVTAADCE
ncbi:GspH/FimT family pseudopilin [Microbulbifer agarilyticus]|uniref:GspH/FimT family pseudopilin n=1 Tax=Microbulbifer agarilyticus TaxID=260552 RepID=UPI001C93CC98|nr:GspH/FimT family pseudopilin [Microbulbifer agarilyticus]MBY6191834.1 GspH/FimT family pseudopilin [Microbulbifer agarilyticus]